MTRSELTVAASECAYSRELLSASYPVGMMKPTWPLDIVGDALFELERGNAAVSEGQVLRRDPEGKPGHNLRRLTGDNTWWQLLDRTVFTLYHKVEFNGEAHATHLVQAPGMDLSPVVG